MSIFAQTIDLGKLIDRRSFTLGMVTAFCECVKGECKKCALSPPMYPEDYYAFKVQVEEIVAEHGLKCYFEENLDQPEGQRVQWWVLYKFDEVLEEYRALRAQGLSPMADFPRFHGVLSYGTAFAEGAEVIVGKLREDRKTGSVSDKVLLTKDGWPPHDR